jgi:chromosome segregation protein
LERERSSKEISELEKEKADLLVRKSLLQAEGEKISSELTDGKASMEKLELELKQADEQVSREEDALKQLEEELLDIRVKFSALQEKESSFQELIRRQSQEKEDLITLTATLSQEQARAAAEIARLEEKENDLAGRLEREKAGLESAEENLQELTRELNLCRRRKEELEAEKEKEHRSLERYERRSYQLNLEKTQLREEKRYLREHHLEKYGVDPDTATHFEIDESEEELQGEKERLSAQIMDLGDVNSGAIEEYERLQERIDFLETQQKDLLLGEKGMQKVMAELDQEMEKRFLQAMHTIERFFLDSFTGLFGGGQAFIKLTDPENVLESGIEIVAQPPGKKLQNITLLSGGEKALTSIALLFAVLQFKPVPFCVLDEIDSSLDESNIERFIGFLKDYSSNTQFIMVTHRQKTMEEADVLYGVTMEEQGISKVLSINLSKKAG